MKNNLIITSVRILFLLTLMQMSISLIAQPSMIRIVAPYNNETIVNEPDIIISWSSYNIKNVDIFYSDDDGFSWRTIQRDLNSKISNFKWQLPFIKDTNILIKISSSENNIVSSIVNFKFSLNKSGLNKKTSSYSVTEKNDENAVKIMPLGDSITEGIYVSDNHVGYRRTLDSLFNNISFNFDFVGSNITGLISDFDRDNEGHGGWHAKHKNLSRRSIVDSLYKWLENAHPDVVLLHIGTNDIGELEIFNESVADVISDVDELLNIIDLYENNYDKSVLVFLAQIIKRVDDPATLSINEEDSTIAYNDSLLTLAENRIDGGDNLVIVNQEDKISYPEDLADGVHPNDNGYKKMGYAWFESISMEMNYYPIILQQPKNKGTIEGSSVEFNLTAAGLEPLHKEWYINDVLMQSGTENNFSIDSANISNDGDLVYCKVYNSLGTVFSDTVKLFVTPIHKKVSGDLLLKYTFEEGGGNLIADSVSQNSEENLVINLPATTDWIDHGLELHSPSSITTSSAINKIYDNCIISNEISIEIWLKPMLVDQSGPARIITYSENGANRNFTIGQELDRYVVRLRTTESNNNGFPEFFSDSNSVVDHLTHLVFTRTSGGKAIIYVDGVKNNEGYLPGNFSNWVADYLLAIGNEIIDERPWLGTLYDINIYSRALDSLEVVHNYHIGEKGVTDIIKPSDLKITNSVIGRIDLIWSDNSLNETGFIIERSDVDTNSFTVIDTLSENSITYSDNTIQEGIPYAYQLRGINNFGVSEPSNRVTLISESNIIFSPSELDAAADSIGNVYLNWNSNSSNNYGFIIERRPDLPDSSFMQIDSTIQSTFTDTLYKFYSVYEYRVKAFNFVFESGYSNIFRLSGITEISNKEVSYNKYNLSQNYPNPFNPFTQISFSLPQRSRIKLEVFNSLGENIRILLNSKVFDSGQHQIEFSGTDLPSGIYFYRLTANSITDKKDFSSVKKMILLK